MKFAVAVLIGAVSACPFSDAMEKPLFGMLEKGKRCPETDAKVLSHHEAVREIARSVYTGFTKGFYQENRDIISDECFGAWGDVTYQTLHGLHKKVRDDIWSVSIDDVKNAGSELVNALYKTAEVCDFERVGDDAKNWCLENPGQCIYLEGLEERLFDNLFEIGGEVFDILKLSMVDDLCYSDMEQMGEIYRFSTDLGELTASISGFDYKWDKSIERKHIKRSSFHKQIREAMEDFKGMDPFQMAFPTLTEILKMIEDCIREEVHKFHESVKMMFPHKQHHKEAHKGMWNPFQIMEPKKDMFHFDPIGDVMKGFEQPQTPRWGEMKMPQFELPHIQPPQPKWDFNNFPHNFKLM